MTELLQQSCLVSGHADDRGNKLLDKWHGLYSVLTETRCLQNALVIGEFLMTNWKKVCILCFKRRSLVL